jgi:hypothetical protein
MERSKAMKLTLESFNIEPKEMSDIKNYADKVSYAHRNASYGLWLTSIGGLLAGVGMIGLWASLKQQLETVKSKIDNKA